MQKQLFHFFFIFKIFRIDRSISLIIHLSNIVYGFLIFHLKYRNIFLIIMSLIELLFYIARLLFICDTPINKLLPRCSHLLNTTLYRSLMMPLLFICEPRSILTILLPLAVQKLIIGIRRGERGRLNLHLLYKFIFSLHYLIFAILINILLRCLLLLNDVVDFLLEPLQFHLSIHVPLCLFAIDFCQDALPRRVLLP